MLRNNILHYDAQNSTVLCLGQQMQYLNEEEIQHYLTQLRLSYLCQLIEYFDKDKRIGKDLLIFDIKNDHPEKIINFLCNDEFIEHSMSLQNEYGNILFKNAAVLSSKMKNLTNKDLSEMHDDLNMPENIKQLHKLKHQHLSNPKNAQSSAKNMLFQACGMY